MDKINKKELLIIVAALLIISVIFIIVTIVGNLQESDTSNINPYTNEEYLTEKELQEKIENLDIYANLDIVVNNLYDFVKVYNGDLETKDYTDYIKNLNKKFKDLYSTINEISLDEQDNYFENNKEMIKNEYGIETSLEFDELLEYIEIYSTENLEYKEVEVEKDSPTDDGDYVKTKVNITYSNDITKTIYVSVIKEQQTDKSDFVLSF